MSIIIGIDASRTAVKEATGTENYSLNLISAIEKIDSQNQYILYFNNPLPVPLVTANNFSSRVIRFPRFWTQARLAWELFSDTPDLLFVPAHTLPVIRPKKLKTVVTIHDLGAEFLKQYHQFPQKLYLNRATEYAAAKADCLIAVSESTKKDLMTKLGVPEEKIAVIYEGVDHDFFKPQEEKAIDQVRQKYHLPAEYLLFVGTIQPRKNLLRLIEAFNLLQRDAKYHNLSLILVGKEGWLAQEIYKAPIRLRIQDRVRFLNHVSKSDLPALYSGAKVFVFPSLYEGFGLPIVEAMSCGVPVITSSTSATAEIAGDAAVVIDPYQVNEIFEAVKELVDNKKNREDLVKKGLIRSKKFTWEEAARKTIKVFEKVYANTQS